ncbi:alpha/beta hydrolase [Allostreptomyces psammosilenae]|uniref:DUF1023 domain-containing protein n=1 Tax=Allostreptomyces psammosilenae TaxID=1892865 RepID=A0A852ZWF6_9ACTN|nr:alpha/beta hydrolase [Allostreptomyces psammosilenae]NYI06733.1 hypothetical protein [Allostreptomyces psammosilenae]
MLTYPHLRDGRFASMAQAAEEFRAVRQAAAEAAEEARRAAEAAPPTVLREIPAGPAGPPASLRDQLADGWDLVRGLDTAATVLARAAETLAARQEELHTVVRQATEAGFTVHEDGSVSAPPVDLNPLNEGPVVLLPWQFDEVRRRLAREAEAHAGAIAAVLARAVEEDDAFARALLAAGRPRTGRLATGAVPTGPVLVDETVLPAPGDPLAASAWWTSLAPAERLRHLAQHPERIGALDGIPARSRDRANRLLVGEARSRLERDLLRLLATEPEEILVDGVVPGTDHDDWRGQVERVRAKIAGLAALENRLGGGTGRPGDDYLLLALDLSGGGRVVVSVGDPDTADNVVTYVPGTGCGLCSLDGDLARAEVLHAAASGRAAGRTASIVWLGYEAPQDLLEAISPSFAENAAQSLDSFLRGLRVAREVHQPSNAAPVTAGAGQPADPAPGRPANSTVIGHSYGSTVVGYALTHGCRTAHRPVDRAVLLGSPGVGHHVAHAADLGLGRDRVWAATAENDLIRHAIDPLYPLAKGSAIHGTDPTDPVFGARIYTVPPGDPAFSETGAVPAHSQYWDSQALDTLAGIVTGQLS